MNEPVVVWRHSDYVVEKPHCLSHAIENALILDDKDEFLRLINRPDFNRDSDLSDPEEIFCWDSFNCCMAVLNGETKGLIDMEDILEEGFTPLHLATLHRSDRLTKYLLDRGHSVDAHPHLIHLVIQTFSSSLNAKRWTPCHSVYEFLVVLCRNMRRELEVLRMLVRNTRNKERVRQTFMDYADKRELVPVALLFLAAPELFLSSYFLNPGVMSSSIGTLYHVLYSLEKRTDIEEAMLLLVDAFATAGHNFVAYTRLQYPNKQAYLRSYLDVAFLVREVSHNKQGLSSPDDYFLRFFKPVRPEEADQLRNIPGPKCLINYGPLPFEIKRHDLDEAYINTVLPSLPTKDADCLNNAIKKKLLLIPTLCGHLEDLTETPNQGVKFPLPRFSFQFSTSYQSIQQPLTYKASAMNTTTTSSRNKLPKSTMPKFPSSRLSQICNIARRFIK